MVNGNTHQAHILQLPAELRERVYSFCLEDESASPGKRVDEPAITRVSKVIRSEALPLYYGSRPWTIQSYVKCDSHGNVWLTTSKWYHRLLPSKLGWLRRLKIRFGFLERYFGEPVTIEFMIELDQRHGTYTMKHSFGAGWFSDAHRKGDPADCEEVLLILKDHLIRSLDESIAKRGIGHFTIVDFDRLVSVDPDTLPQ